MRIRDTARTAATTLTRKATAAATRPCKPRGVRAHAEAAPHREPEIEAAEVHQRPLENVAVPAQVGPSHRAGVIAVGKGPFEELPRAIPKAFQVQILVAKLPVERFVRAILPGLARTAERCQSRSSGASADPGAVRYRRLGVVDVARRLGCGQRAVLCVHRGTPGVAA